MALARAIDVSFMMCLSITLSLLTASYACRSYYTSDKKMIPLGCISGINGSDPWEPTTINTSFIVYDQNNMDDPQRVFLWNASFDPSNALFKAGDKLQFVIHGFRASSKEAWVHKLKDAYLGKDHRTKVIVVDWSVGALVGDSTNITNPRLQGANNALMVGRVVACFIERVMSTYGIPETSVSVFGHSMGGQVMGRAVAWLIEKFGIRIGMGTSSETSAQPFISEGIYPEKKNVHFMLAMHTASVIPGSENRADARGFYKAFADVDLYANRGIPIQPACRGKDVDLCSHEQAYVFITELVTECNEDCDFQGFICESEWDAFNDTCSNRTVNVCSFIRNHEANEEQSNRRSTVLAFETDLDQLPIECA